MTPVTRCIPLAGIWCLQLNGGNGDDLLIGVAFPLRGFGVCNLRSTSATRMRSKVKLHSPCGDLVSAIMPRPTSPIRNAFPVAFPLRGFGVCNLDLISLLQLQPPVKCCIPLAGIWCLQYNSPRNNKCNIFRCIPLAGIWCLQFFLSYQSY